MAINYIIFTETHAIFIFEIFNDTFKGLLVSTKTL